MYRDPDEWFVQVLRGGVGPTAAGEDVNEFTALGIAAYSGAIRVISEDTAKPPRKLRRQLSDGKWDHPTDHPVYTLMHDRWNPTCSAFDGVCAVTACALAFKGGFAEILRRGNGYLSEPVGLYPLDPRRISWELNSLGEIDYYLWRDDNGNQYRIDRTNMLHIRGMGFDGITQWVVSQIARETLGAALGAQKFSASFFGNGAIASGVLQHPGRLGDTALKHLKESLKDQVGGDAKYSPLVLEEGMTWQTTSANPEESQMLESMIHFGVEEVCRMFRLNPNKLQHWHKATYANYEFANIDHINDTIMPWWLRWENEVKAKLLNRRGDEDIRMVHNIRGLLRGDLNAQANFFREQFNIGCLTQNEIRGFQDLPPVPNGDTYYVNAAMIPVELVHKKWESSNQPSPNPVGNLTPAVDNADRAKTLDGIRKAHTALLTSTFDRLLTLEADKCVRLAKQDTPGARTFQFFQKHNEYVVNALSDPVNALVATVAAVLPDYDEADVCPLVQQAADDHCARSRTEIGELLKRTNNYAQHRAEAEAVALVDRILSKLTRVVA